MSLADNKETIARTSATGMNVPASAIVLTWGTSLHSNDADAYSPLASEFRGDWRLDGQFCSGFDKEDSAINFGVDPGLKEYVSFGTAKCALRESGDVSLAIAKTKACRNSGFPVELMGEYTLIVVDHHKVSGHIAFRNLQGEMQFMKDCSVHK